MEAGAGELVFAAGMAERRVAVIVPLHNYRAHIVEALDSVLAQSFGDVMLIVVDDASTDDSLSVAREWMERQAECHLSLRLVAHGANAGLSRARNTGIAVAASEFCFFLDADNALYPQCLAAHVEALDAHPAAAGAYGLIEVFGRARAIMGGNAFSRARLARGNTIDAMAMVRRSVLEAHEGFAVIPHGWEDYDLWLRMCEAGQHLVQIPEILARYRNHATSMLRSRTNVRGNIEELHRTICARHPWLTLPALPWAKPAPH
jgi:glycosyltransferase involved in cell wall biosynthesis